jgi:hypothetical protein
VRSSTQVQPAGRRPLAREDRPRASRSRPRRIGAGALALALTLAGCGGGELLERHPELAAIDGQKLADANPYLLVHDGRLRWFHCRWPTGAAIPVSLPPDADARERRALEAALRAWEGAGLGVRFAPAEDAGNGIEIRFVGGTVDTAAGQDTANSVVDCAIAPLSQQVGPSVVGARLVAARILIARLTNQDMQGRQRPLSDGELAGSALHELGHALGLQGHARQGDTVMVREVERIARAGKHLLAGQRFADPTLRALYRLPSGAVVGGGALDRCRTDLVDRMARLAEENGLAGPFARVGEAAARLWWRDDDGEEWGFLFARLREARADPSRLYVQAESNVRASLAAGLDAPCAAPD